MKQLFISIAVIIITATSMKAAEAVEINGLYYFLNGDSATVTRYNSSTSYSNTSIKVPSTVSYNNKTYVVTKIHEGTFSSRSLKNITLPKSITEIGKNAFTYCEKLESITIPPKVKTIPSEMCFGCTALTNITIPNNVTKINTQAFLGCSSLTTLTIGENVQSIENGAFDYDTKLDTVYWNAKKCTCYQMGKQVKHFYFGDKVEIIPNNLCYGMNKIDSIIVPNSVKKICGSAFAGCSQLSFVEIGDSVTEIEGSTFEDCTSLKKIIIGASTTKIVDWAFNNCINLNTIIMKCTTPPSIGENTFSEVPLDVIIIVPCGAETAYRSAQYWQDFTNIQSAIPFNVNLSSEDVNKGSVEVTKHFECENNEMTIVAKPMPQYRFSRWSDGNRDNPRVVIISSDTSYIALFDEIKCDVNLISNDSTLGITLGSGSYSKNSTIVIYAIAKNNNQFIKWSDESTNNIRSIKLTTDTMLSAIFAPKQPITCLNVSVNDSVEGNAYIQIIAIPNEGYKFISWDDGNTDNPRMIAIGDAATYTAFFAGMPTNISERDMSSTKDKLNKFIQKGNLHIIREGKTYNAQGGEVR